MLRVCLCVNIAIKTNKFRRLMDSFILIANFTMAAGIIFLTTFQTDCNWEKK